MSAIVGCVGYGNLSEQTYWAGGSTVAGTKPAAGTPVLSPVSVTSAGVTSGGINRLGANSARFVINCGAITGAGAFTATVQHSNDDGVTDAYAATTVAGWGALATPAGGIGGTASNTDTYLDVDLRGDKKWVRLVITNTAGTSALLAASCFLGAFDTLPAEQ